ncbi:MAG: recombination mediator RecR [Candidatus Cloacimonetes bacterium]|nr:recombination mediator RecR [Candidatus Cloacimonadota bacterium]
MSYKQLENLQQALKKLPGIGSKTARRLAYYMVSRNTGHAMMLADAITSAIEANNPCPECNLLTEGELCEFCADPERNQSLLCVVQDAQDVMLIENTHEFKGRYFVLGGLLSPLHGIGPEEIHFPQLKKLVEELPLTEIILALNPSAEGDTTIHYIVEKFETMPFKITRLATGIPFGGDIEYTTPVTLTNALFRRYEAD